jgi:phosphoglycolate phosphatase-like HAD superfamily hydrolase
MTTTDYDYMRSGEIVDGALPKASFVFDLDGTLVDSVYQHVLAWRTALESEGINLSVWRIHRKIGMSGGLFTNMLLRETGYHIDSANRCSDGRSRPGRKPLPPRTNVTGTAYSFARRSELQGWRVRS